jgi:hypothetical protein
LFEGAKSIYPLFDFKPFIVAVGFLFVVALLLYLAPFKITNVMIPGTSRITSRMTARFERTGIILIGIYLLSRGAVGIVYNLTLLLYSSLTTELGGSTIGHNLAASMSALVEISAGLILVFGARAIGGFLKRTRQSTRPERRPAQ